MFTREIYLFRIFCSDSSAIWPKPTGDITVGNYLTAINIHSIDILGGKSETPTFQLVLDAGRVFKKQLELLIPRFAALEFSNFDLINANFLDIKPLKEARVS